jgi:hypothetical protein
MWFMLSVTRKLFMLSVIMLNVVKLNVVAPKNKPAAVAQLLEQSTDDQGFESSLCRGGFVDHPSLT